MTTATVAYIVLITLTVVCPLIRLLAIATRRDIGRR